MLCCFISSGSWRLFLFIFCVLFGVIAQECYQTLKNDTYKFRKVLPKLTLAWFVCMIIGGLLNENPFFTKYYPFIIMLFAFIHRICADWIMTDFFPLIKEIIIRSLTKNK